MGDFPHSLDGFSRGHSSSHSLPAYRSDESSHGVGFLVEVLSPGGFFVAGYLILDLTVFGKLSAGAMSMEVSSVFLSLRLGCPVGARLLMDWSVLDLDLETNLVLVVAVWGLVWYWFGDLSQLCL